MSSQLMRLIPGHCFDVHALRTLKQYLVVVLLRLEEQFGPCRPTESIQEVVRALSLTMRDVEEAWPVWRHNLVRAILNSGFMYTRARIRAADWRRHQGLPPAAFVQYQSLYPAFRYEGAPPSNQPLTRQAEAGPVTQADEAYNHYHAYYGNLGDHTYQALAQPSDAQYPQFSRAPAHGSTYAVSQNYNASPQTGSAGAWDYPPPPYPPPHQLQHQHQQQPLINNVNAEIPSRPPPLSPDVAAAVEVATRFLEAVNKAVNICIELNAR